MTGRELVKEACRALSAAGIESTEREAAILLAEVIGCSPAECSILDDIDRKTEIRYNKFIQRRVSGEPIQTIAGEWEFYGRPIRLREGVFIPRPETEGLVEFVLKYIPNQIPRKGLEIGIGCGAISINLLAERPELTMVGTDISSTALDLAEDNARVAGVFDRLFLIKTDIADGIEGSFDFIVSNPPYIMTHELAELPDGVISEPRQALDGGADGLGVINRIVETAVEIIKPGGFMALEIHEKLGVKVKELIERRFSSPEIRKDLSGKDRYALAFKEA